MFRLEERRRGAGNFTCSDDGGICFKVGEDFKAVEGSREGENFRGVESSREGEKFRGVESSREVGDFRE